MTQPPSDKIFKVTETGNLRLLIDSFSVMSAEGTAFVYGGGYVDVPNNSSGFVVIDSGTGVASVTTNGSDTTKYYLAYVQASQGTSRIVQQFENGPYKQAGVDGGGTVTAVSVVTANGFSGTVATPTSTPAITIDMADGTVTLAKMADLSTGKVIGRSTAGTGVPEALDAGSVGLSVLAATTQAAARSTIGAGTVTDVSVTTANGVSGSVATSTTTPAITLTLGAITPESAAFSGTGGNGFVKLLTQSSAPTSPASGFALFADASGRLSWRRASDGFVRTFELTATADRVFTIPDASFTLAGQNLTNTFSLANTFSANGALSTPAVSITGTPITGGSATTTKPLVLIETSGATSTAWHTSGTMFGVNAPNAFSGTILEAQVNGASRLTLSSGGAMTLAASGIIQWNGRAILNSPSAANLALGAADAASPVAQTIGVQNVAAGTTDTAGVNFTINGSRGTGTGAGGSIVFQTAPAGSTGSSQNNLVEALRITPTGLLRFGAAGSSAAPVIFPFSGSTYNIEAPSTGRGLTFYNYSNTAGDTGFAITGGQMTQTSGTQRHVQIVRSFAPTSGTGVYAHVELTPTINQTGGANGITYGLRINPSLVSAADFRALEISDGNVVLPKTVTAAGTTGARTINKLTGTVNFAAAATSLVVTNSYVTTSSIIIATVGTNDATMKSVQAVAGSGSFTLYASAAPTGETRVDFHVTN